MNGSFRIGRLFGIDIRVHWLFLVIVFVFLQLTEYPLIALLGAAGLLGSLLLHELGHSLMARHFGIQVLDITFWPLGGMARMSAIPEVPRIEGLIAIAGPAVNFVLAGLALPVLLAAGAAQSAALANLALTFIVVNLMLGGFNLLPAFPMDGGRILRALLGLRFDWLRATEVAVRVGRVMAFLLVVAGIASSQCVLPFIGAFVWFAGTKELIWVRMRHGASPFAGGAGPAAAFGSAADAFGRAADPRETGRGEPRRPRTDVEGWSSSGGISDAQVEQLERYRGRLRRRGPEDAD